MTEYRDMIEKGDLEGVLQKQQLDALENEVAREWRVSAVRVLEHTTWLYATIFSTRLW